MSISVRAFKLKSSEEIIGRCISAKDPIILEKVRMYILAGADQSGQLQVNVMPYSAVAPDGSIELYESNIAAEILDLPKEVVNGYISSTSNIQIAGPV